ncbi:MAG: hypothetical protein EON54_13940 [Alcaligenaceae bacterium]|nr:MAG: hypothetical protein EON54_13940 [Alcaligenaceae bacterium]
MEDREISIVTRSGVIVRYPGATAMLDSDEGTLIVFCVEQNTKATFNWRNVEFFAETGRSEDE